MLKLSTITLASLLWLTGCTSTAERLSRIGEPPRLNPVVNPVERAGYTPVSLPLPEKKIQKRNTNSLWQTGSRSFFKDLRASEVGDILTVEIDIDDEAQLSNTSTRQRDNSESGGIDNLFGTEKILGQIFNDQFDAGNLIGLSSEVNNRGTGAIQRQEEIKMKVAAVVTQELPNGNLVVVGRQEVRVNYEVRELQIAGIVRPEDITSANIIPFEKIAEARISYGGRGHISDVQKPRYGQEFLDIILPF